MDRSSSQKVLRVISIIEIIFGALGIVAGLMSSLGAGLIGAAVTASGGAADVSVEEVGMASAAFSILSVVAIASSILLIIEGVLGIRAANDNQKIMPVWVLSIIGLVFSCIGIIMGIAQGTIGNNIIGTLASVAVNALMFWIANNIKKEAGR